MKLSIEIETETKGVKKSHSLFVASTAATLRCNSNINMYNRKIKNNINNKINNQQLWRLKCLPSNAHAHPYVEQVAALRSHKPSMLG